MEASFGEERLVGWSWWFGIILIVITDHLGIDDCIVDSVVFSIGVCMGLIVVFRQKSHQTSISLFIRSIIVQVMVLLLTSGMASFNC